MKKPILLPLALLAPILLIGCGLPAGSRDDGSVEVVSLLGEELSRPVLAAGFRAEQAALLAKASAEIDSDPDEVDGWIWQGRRTAYLGKYREAIEIYTKGIERFPGEARLFRHRGHRYISVRELDRAIGDLELAASLVAGTPDQIEPDGLPNARGIPTSTLHTNIHYHLGLARYLRGDFAGARRAYSEGLEAAANPDMRSAMSYWLLLTLWHLGSEPEARLLLSTIDADWDLIENEDYHGLLRGFAGDSDPRALLEEAREAGGVRFATVGYGVGAWLRHVGKRDEAMEVWREVITGDRSSAFGRIAAEAELAR